MGGRGAGRSTVASQYASSRLISPQYFRCAVMRYVLGDVRNSIYADIHDRLEETGTDRGVNISPNILTMKYGTNSIQGMGFKRSSSDQKSKMKSLANYTDVIIEEADEVSEEDFIQLDDSLRTIKADIKITLLLNCPDKNHWIIKRWFNLEKSEVEGYYKVSLKESEKHNTNYIHTNYSENKENLNQQTIDNFERYKETRPDHYYNMIKGYVSEGKRGLCFNDWKPISDKEYENLDYPVFYGLDFGFTNDPTALVEMKLHNNKLYVKELVYETGLLDEHMAKKFQELDVKRTADIWGDGQEARSIETLRRMDWNVMGAKKGAGSRKFGVNQLCGLEVYYTENSENLKKEIQEYHWVLDRNKEPTNEPSDGNDHLIDAIRYGTTMKIGEPLVGFV